MERFIGGTDILHRLNYSLAAEYQTQLSAWLFEGDSTRRDGFGVGTLDGIGQV